MIDNSAKISDAIRSTEYKDFVAQDNTEVCSIKTWAVSEPTIGLFSAVLGLAVQYLRAQ